MRRRVTVILLLLVALVLPALGCVTHAKVPRPVVAEPRVLNIDTPMIRLANEVMKLRGKPVEDGEDLRRVQDLQSKSGISARCRGGK